MTVLEIAKKLNRAYKNEKLALTADVVPSYRRLPCGDLGADFPLYGGLPYGRMVTISGKEHSGKAQPLDSLVLGEHGYIRMGDIRLGDKVFGRDGKLHKVSGVYPQGKKPVYKISFRDGTSTLCSDEHLWNVTKLRGGAYVKDAKGNIQWKTVTLKEILNTPLQGTKGEYLYRIPKCDTVEFSPTEVPIDPYLLGCLIGDGSLNGSGIGFTNADADIVKRVDDILHRDYKMKLMPVSDIDYAIVPDDNVTTYRGYWYVIKVCGNEYHGVPEFYASLSENLREEYSFGFVAATIKKYLEQHSLSKRSLRFLREFDNIEILTNPYKTSIWSSSVLDDYLKSFNLKTTSEYKHIPDCYKFNSPAVRLAILQGLMDTDGYIDSQGHASFGSASKQLVEDVRFIVESFGGYCYRIDGIGSYKTPQGELRHCKPTYSLDFSGLSHDIQVVSCERKLQRYKSYNIKQTRHLLRAITNIEFVSNQECQCIMLDSNEHLYLTNNCIVTHNTTGAAVFLAAYQRANPDRTCLYVDVEHSLDKEFQAAMTGLDLTKLVYLNPEGMSGEQILDAIIEFQDSEDIGMIVLDSIAALVSSREYDNDVEKDSGLAASMAKPLARFIKKMLDQLTIRDNILLLINQVRQVGTTFTGAPILDEPCGHSPKYYASVKLRFGTRTFTQGDKVDCRDGENADGFRLVFATTKNKTASTQRGGGFLTFRYDTGLDWVADLLEVAIKYEFIKRPNNMTYVLVNLETGEPYQDAEGNVLKFVGKQKLKDYLRSNIDFQNEYLTMLNKHIQATSNQYGSLLDARQLAEMTEQEHICEKDTDTSENS